MSQDNTMHPVDGIAFTRTELCVLAIYTVFQKKFTPILSMIIM